MMNNMYRGFYVGFSVPPESKPIDVLDIWMRERKEDIV